MFFSEVLYGPIYRQMDKSHLSENNEFFHTKPLFYICHCTAFIKMSFENFITIIHNWTLYLNHALQITQSITMMYNSALFLQREPCYTKITQYPSQLDSEHVNFPPNSKAAMRNSELETCFPTQLKIWTEAEAAKDS